MPSSWKTAAGNLGVCAPEDGWNRSVADLQRINARIKADNPGKPVVLFGHSMGSFMTQQYMMEYGDTIDAVVLSGSTLVEGFAEMVPVLEAEAAESGRDAPSLAMSQTMAGGMNEGIENPKTTHDWLSRDEAEVKAYLDDPLCGFELSIGAVYDMLAANRIPGKPEEFSTIRKELPVYIFAGDRDPVSQNAQALHLLASLYRAAGLVRVDCQFYPGGRHEMLNEINRDEVTQDLVNWLDSAIPGN